MCRKWFVRTRCHIYESSSSRDCKNQQLMLGTDLHLQRTFNWMRHDQLLKVCQAHMKVNNKCGKTVCFVRDDRLLCFTAKTAMAEWGDTGPLRPVHIREAFRRVSNEGMYIHHSGFVRICWRCCKKLSVSLASLQPSNLGTFPSPPYCLFTCFHGGGQGVLIDN